MDDSDVPISPHLIKVCASYSYQTYMEIYVGRPSVKSMMDDAKKKAENLWGTDRPTLILDPPIKGSRLPSYCHMIWAEGPVLDESDNFNDGSHLVVIWWSEFEPDTRRVLNSISWKKYAKEFQI